MGMELKSDPARGVTVAGGSVYYSLGSPHWINMNRSPFAPYTYHYSKPGEGWNDGEMATMNLANWGGAGHWDSAQMRLEAPLGFGRYEQSIKVGSGSGATTAFYLSEYDQNTDKPKDQDQEIDFEFAGYDHTCLQVTVWRRKKTPQDESVQYPIVYRVLPDSSSGWGGDVYRYKIDWEPDAVTWAVDLKGSGNSYTEIRKQEMSTAGSYDESLCYVYLSFWCGWTPDGSKFLSGADAKGTCGESGPCYQAYFFQSLKFTPSGNNKLVTLVG